MSRKNYEIGFLGDPFFDDFDDFFTVPKAYHRFENNVMKTDIQEIDNNYVLKVDIPGAKKEDISLKYYGSMSRSFYVGDAYKQKDINATYSDGVLTITLPIIDATKQSEEPTKIEIK